MRKRKRRRLRKIKIRGVRRSLRSQKYIFWRKLYEKTYSYPFTRRVSYDKPFSKGTWTLTGQVCEDAVYAALKSGYRLIDTAKYYGNESEVGKAVARAISDGICKREEIFITTKLVPWSSNPDADIDDSIRQLGLTYIDLCLLHQHGSSSGDDAVYKAMIRAAKDGKIRSIGISNFYTEKTVSHFINDFEIPPAVIQNENHLKYQNNSLRDWAAKKGIYIEIYYPFGGRGHTAEHLKNPQVLEIAKKHNTSSQGTRTLKALTSPFLGFVINPK